MPANSPPRRPAPPPEQTHTLVAKTLGPARRNHISEPIDKPSLTLVSAETSAGPPARGVASPACRLANPAHPGRCHLDDGPAISPAAAQALACHATVSWMLHDHDGNLLDVGRRHRLATPALRRAVRERDKGRCQFPGCNSRRTDIHHVVPWAKGGKTRLRDLILLCEAHHVIVHALGYLITPTQKRIRLHPPRRPARPQRPRPARQRRRPGPLPRRGHHHRHHRPNRTGRQTRPRHWPSGPASPTPASTPNRPASSRSGAWT